MVGRRNAFEIIHEILAVSIDGISKTQVVYRTNLNFRLMQEYLGFLTSSGYLQRSLAILPVQFKLTIKGRRLLKILVDLEREVAGFRATPVHHGQQVVLGGTMLPMEEPANEKAGC